MKNIKFILFFVLISGLLVSCSKDEMPNDDNVDPGTTDIELYINEILSTGDPDWVELYNASTEAIDLSGFKVSDGPEAKVTLPAGTTIAAKGYYIFPCTDFGLSSGGEKFYIWDAEGKLVDNVEFPALDAGISYGRQTDGGSTWTTMSPTQGAANSTVSVPPNLIALEIEGVNDNFDFVYKVKASDADGIREVMLFTDNGTRTDFIDFAPIGGGEYICTINRMVVDTEVDYYVVATDESGAKTYFPSTAPGTMNKFTVEDGNPVFMSFAISTENPAPDQTVDVTVEVFDVNGFNTVRLYYVLNDQLADAKVVIDMQTTDNKTYTATIPGQSEGTVIRYYLRVEDANGNKTYYPNEETDDDGNVTGDFDHDDAATWQSVTAAPLAILDALVINEIFGTGAPDFVELYNGTSAAIDLGGYKIHDPDVNEAYVIPNGTTIPAGGFYVLDCDGAATTLFKISSGGEDITLLDPSGNVVDQLLGVNWPAGHVGHVGRPKDGAAAWTILTSPTKGTTNNP